MAAPKFNNIKNYLENFGKKVVRDSKKILKKEKGSTALGKSIKFKVVATAKGFDTQFFMDDYGTYLDEGVSGNKKKQSYINTKGEKKISQYSYTSKGPPIDILSKWIKKKGIKSISFFQQPLGVEYKKLQKQILKILKLDIETYITTFTK